MYIFVRILDVVGYEGTEPSRSHVTTGAPRRGINRSDSASATFMISLAAYQRECRNQADGVGLLDDPQATQITCHACILAGGECLYHIFN